MILVFIPV